MLDINKYKVKIEDLKYDCSINSTEIDKNYSQELIIGQDRAVKAIEFALNMDKKGYNLYVSGQSGLGKTRYTKHLIEKNADKNKKLKDWVYVNNFKNSNEPIALSFNCGKGKVFKDDINDVIEKIKSEIPKIFESEEYETHSRMLMSELESNIEKIIEELNIFAQPKGFKFHVTERGLVSVPIKEDGNIIQESELGQLTSKEIVELRERGMKLNQESKEYVDRIKVYENEYKDSCTGLDRNVGRSLVGYYERYLSDRYGEDNKVREYIKEFCNDIVNNISKFKPENDEIQQNPMSMLNSMLHKKDNKFFDRYEVNLFIDNTDKDNSKAIEETNPTYYNLVGCIEYKNEIGALTTNFTEIKPGALHNANGGYLIINAKDLLKNPFSWDALKRTLKTNKITIECLNKQYGYLVTSTLKPEPIDLDIKVILVGDSYMYSMLYAYDEEFRYLFKVMADFDTELKNTDENIRKIITLIYNRCKQDNLKLFDVGAIEKIIEYSARMSSNKNKLSARFDKIIELMYEANSFSENKEVKEEDVQKAINQRIYMSNKYEEQLNEMFEEGTLLIDIEGKKVGQINGLAVMSVGDYCFGKPSKITASTYRGRRGIINVEREIKQSGSIHDKGVLILSGYLGERYGKHKPLSITTSITFEQNYNGVDGDSASSTELYAIISSIGDIPLRQDIAVTGSVSQKGEIQPIGGINEKIEGYFDVCKIKGITKTQGVMMPIQNVRNLMLKQEVVDAVKNGEFNIYAVSSIDEGLEVLTGKDKKEIDKIINNVLDKNRKIDKELEDRK